VNLLKIGISGVRGVAGQTLTPELVLDFAGAFGTWVRGGPVCLGRDSRLSGPMLRQACLSALAATGCDVLDLGLCPTPVLQYTVRARRAGGGISITAGHNDKEWNALTFISREGSYLNSYQGEEMLDIFHLGKFSRVGVDGLGKVILVSDHVRAYFEALEGFLDAAAIRRAGFKVAYDPCGGAGAGLLSELGRRLGFEVAAINDEPTGHFPHDPEPRPRNARQAAVLVKVTRGDAGFVLNSDASRVSLVAEDGETLSEEFTFPLVAAHVLSRTPGPVVTNLSTSRMIDDVAGGLDCPVTRTKVGQSFVVEGMVDEEAVVGGDGSGSVAVAAFQPAFDGFLTIGLILESMARSGKRLSALAAALPRYHNVKEKVRCAQARVYSVLSEVKKLLGPDAVETVDGLRVEGPAGWLHVRASATEPMIRVIAEDTDKEAAQSRVDDVVQFISVLVK
jgi:phosphomannomutase